MNLPRRCTGSTAWIIIKVGKERKGNFSSTESCLSRSFPADNIWHLQRVLTSHSPPAPVWQGWLLVFWAQTGDRTISLLIEQYLCCPQCLAVPPLPCRMGQDERQESAITYWVGYELLEEPAETFPASLHTKVSGRHSLGLAGEQKPFSPQNQVMLLPGYVMTLGRFGLGHMVIKKSSHPELGVAGGP